MEDAELGARVAEVRLFAGMSQEQVGKAIGLDRSQMCKLEKGERKVSARELRGLADALSCDVDYLLYPEFAGSPRFRAAASGNNAEADLLWMRRFRRRYDLVVEHEAS